MYDKLIALGIPYSRLKNAMDGGDNWGKLVHAFEYITTIGVVLDAWPEHLRDG